MEHQLSFGVERDVLVDELEYYFEQIQSAEMQEEEFQALIDHAVGDTDYEHTLY